MNENQQLNTSIGFMPDQTRVIVKTETQAVEKRVTDMVLII